MGEVRFRRFPGGKIKVTYTGTYTDEEKVMSGVKYRLLTLISSGTLTLSKAVTADIFAVGGGGAGGTSSTSGYSCSGGGGGYTKTVKAIQIQKENSLVASIGSAGLGYVYPHTDGGATTASINGTVVCTAEGGKTTGAGGSGGGNASTSNDDGYRYNAKAGNGGSDGSSGKANGSSGTGYSGQGTTTRAFGEADGKLCSGGGGGYAQGDDDSEACGSGGAGGGGTGRKISGNDATDFGGGGGAGVDYTIGHYYSGSGYKGVLMVRWPI